MQRVLRDIFLAPQLPHLFGTRSPDLEQAEEPPAAVREAVAAAFSQQHHGLKSAREGGPRTAPPDSLAARSASERLVFYGWG